VVYGRRCRGMTRRGRDRMPRALGESSVIHARQMGGPGPASLGVRKKDETRRVLIIGGRKGLAWSAAVPTKPSTGMGTSGPFIFFPRSGRDQSGPVVPVRSEEEVGAMLRVHEASFLVVPCAGRRAGVHAPRSAALRVEGRTHEHHQHPAYARRDGVAGVSREAPRCHARKAAR
jgi:hypothetical protein